MKPARRSRRFRWLRVNLDPYLKGEFGLVPASQQLTDRHIKDAGLAFRGFESNYKGWLTFNVAGAVTLWHHAAREGTTTSTFGNLTRAGFIEEYLKPAYALDCEEAGFPDMGTMEPEPYAAQKARAP